MIKALYSVLLGLLAAGGDAGVQYLHGQAADLSEAGIVGVVVAVLARLLGVAVKKIPVRPTLGVLLLVLGGTACTRAEAAPVERVALLATGRVQNDSIQLRITVQVAAAPKPGGRALDHYAYRVVRQHPTIDTVLVGTFPGTSATVDVWYPRPAPGTTDTVQSIVWGVTDIGTPGDSGFSNRLPVATADAGLTAPDVTLDSTTLSQALDSITLHMASSAARFSRVDTTAGFVLAPSTDPQLGQAITDPDQRWPYDVYTDTVTVCAALWRADLVVGCGCDPFRCSEFPLAGLTRPLYNRYAAGHTRLIRAGG